MARASGIGRNGLLLIPELCLDTAKVGKKRQCSGQSESKTEKLDITTCEPVPMSQHKLLVDSSKIPTINQLSLV